MNTPSDAELNRPIVRALFQTGGEDAVADHVGRLREQRDEVLAALKEMVRDYEMLLGDGGLTDSTAPPLLRDAHAAIAKAEGK